MTWGLKEDGKVFLLLGDGVYFGTFFDFVGIKGGKQKDRIYKSLREFTQI
jgi:hypothetical protein